MNKSQLNVPFAPRAELGRFQAYKPGLSIDDIERRYGLKGVIKLASNENPLGCSRKAWAAYKKAGKRFYRYPESRSVELRRALAERHRVDIDEVIVGAGSDEIIELLAKAYLNEGDEIIVSAASFIQYQSAGHLMGARVVTIPLNEMKIDLMAMAAAATSKTKFVFVANPNNPTGTYNSRSEIARFLKSLPLHILPVFDEAYFEYAAVKNDYPSMVSDFFRQRPMVVLRTFSKVYGLAGLRVGYGIAPEECVSTLDKIRQPFNVSVPAQAAAQAALFDTKHVAKSVRLNETEKAKLEADIQSMGFAVVPSAANFILFKVSPWTGRALFEKLLYASVIARAVDEYGLSDYLRMTVGTRQENKKFLNALREVTKTK